VLCCASLRHDPVLCCSVLSVADHAAAMGADLSAEPGPQGILQSVSGLGLGRPEDGESAADPQMASLCHLASEVCLHACMYVCVWDPLGSFSSRRLPFCFLCEGGRRCCSPVPRVDRGGAHPEDLLQGLPRGRRHAVHPHLGGAQEVDCLPHGRSAQIPLRCEPSLTRPCSCPPHPSRLVVKAILAWLLCACRSPWSLFGLEGKAESFGPRCWARW